MTRTLTAAPEIATINCGRCQLPMAVVVSPGVFAIAGVTVRIRRYTELICPTCGFTNGWHGKPAVQDVHHVVERRGGES